MSWLITGASGQLGLAVQIELISRNIEFAALSSKDLDITDEKSVENIVSAASPQVLINCAAWTDVDGAEENQTQAYNVNALGPKYLALSAKKVGAKYIHFSTDYVFSGDHESPWREDDERKPNSIYGQTKLDGEKFVQEIYPEGSYLVRTAWLYSSNGKNFAKTMTNLALSGNQEIKVVNDQIGQPTSANDLAKQVVNLVLSKATTGVYHGTNGGQATWFEFAQEIFELAGADKKRVKPVSTEEFPRPAKRPNYSVLSHQNWHLAGLPQMRNWRIALEDEFSKILLEQKREQ
jgi:dTDP-4-dehydrorhamnose reductase